jgi:hypothetical protein
MIFFFRNRIFLNPYFLFMFIVWSAGDKIQSASRSGLGMPKPKNHVKLLRQNRKWLARRGQKIVDALR